MWTVPMREYNEDPVFRGLVSATTFAARGVGCGIVVDGRVVGTWRRRLGRGEVSVEWDLFEALTEQAKRAREDERERAKTANDARSGGQAVNQTVAATGRLSSSDPNLQNIPIRTEEGLEIRRAFVPRDGWVLLSADYSQIELRILAHCSADETLIRAFRDEEDIHTRTASEVFQVEPSRVTPELRRQAKAINFGIIYGISAFGLANQLGIPREEAGAYIKRYFEHLFELDHLRVRFESSETRQYRDIFIRSALVEGEYETRAPFFSNFFSPQDWIRRAAVFPSDGLRNTLPAFGRLSGCVAMRLRRSSAMRSRAGSGTCGRTRSSSADT